nr:hypothetical protein [Tanacetum cinerariifolium]
MFDDDWGLESMKVSPLGEEVSLFDRINKVERRRILEAHRLEPILQQQISQRMAPSHHDASRPYIQFSTCLCARYQANPKESHLVAVKTICRYLKAEAEYVAAAGCYAQFLWIKSQLVDYDILYDKVPIFYDNTSAIAISNNPVLLSRIKHIDIRYTVEADTTSKSITFTLLHFDKPLSFDLDMFSFVIGIDHSDEFVDILPKETVKAGLATLGFVDKDHPSLSSYDLIKWSPSLIPPSGEVNVDDFADKSLSGTSMPPVTQPKTPTAKRPRKKKIPFLTQPKVLKLTRISKSSSTQSTHLQQAEEFVVTTDATKSLDASESTEVQGNQPKTVDAAKVLDQNVIEEEDVGVHYLEEPTFKHLMDEVDNQNKAAQEQPESPYDTESEIKFVKSFKSSLSTHLEDEEHDDANITFIGSEQVNNPSLSPKKTQLTTSMQHLMVILLYHMLPLSALSNPIGHLQRELSIIFSKVDQRESCITKHVFEELKSFVPSLEYVGEKTSVFQAQVHQILEEQLASLIYKPMNKQFNAFNKIESQRFVHLEKELTKCIKTKLSKVFREKLCTITSQRTNTSRDPSKGKEVATEESMKELIPYIEERGSDPNMLKMKSLVTLEGVLSHEDLMAQLKEMKRLADLKAEKKEFEKALIKLINPATVKDQTWKLAEYKEKKAKMLDEYNKCIYERADPLPITKMHYKAKKLGLPPPPELVHFGKPVEDIKRKRTEILQEVFMKENIVVDGMHRNLIPSLGIVGSRGQVIKEPESGIFFYNGNFDLVFQREEEFHLATTAQLIRQQSAIQRGTPEAEEMIKKLELTMEARDDVIQARKIIQDNLDGLCQDIEQHQTYSNQRHRQGSQILLEDTLVSRDGYQLDKRVFELKPIPSMKLVKVVNSWQNYSLKYGRVVSKNRRALNTSKFLSLASLDLIFFFSAALFSAPSGQDPGPSSTQSIPLLGAIIFTNIQVYALAGGLGFGCRASFIIHSESASGNDASAASTARADLGNSAPSDFVPQQQ